MYIKVTDIALRKGERRLESTDKIADMQKFEKLFTPYSGLVPRPVPGNRRLVVERRLESTDKIAESLGIVYPLQWPSSQASAWEQEASCGEKVRVH